MYFAKEGYLWIFIGTVLTLASHFTAPVDGEMAMMLFFARTLPLALITCFMIYFFRDPNRKIEASYRDKENIAVVSPADGSICAIQEEGGDLAIYVELHVTNVHVQRAHISGRVLEVVRWAGNHYPVYFLKKKIGAESRAIKKNARVVIKMEDDDGGLFEIQLICGQLARRAKSYVMAGEYVQKGQRVGIISFGSLVKITVPGTNYKHIIKVGQNVYGGKTVLLEKL